MDNGGGGGSPIDNHYDPLIYGVHQVEGLDNETLSLFTSATEGLNGVMAFTANG